MSGGCILCEIRDDRVPVSKLYEDDFVFAIDVPPDMPFYCGPVHFLVIPNRHVPNALHLRSGAGDLCGRLFAVTGELAREKNIADSGFRLIANTGPDANQTVSHFHLHCIGGRKLRDEC